VGYIHARRAIDESTAYFNGMGILTSLSEVYIPPDYWSGEKRRL